MEYRNPVTTTASRGFGVTKPNYGELNESPWNSNPKAADKHHPTWKSNAFRFYTTNLFFIFTNL
jgi:hypothetical protein